MVMVLDIHNVKEAVVPHMAPDCPYYVAFGYEEKKVRPIRDFDDVIFIRSADGNSVYAEVSLGRDPIELLQYGINDPVLLRVYEDRLTDKERAFARELHATWVSRDPGADFVDLWNIRPSAYDGHFDVPKRKNNDCYCGCIPAWVFPSVQRGFRYYVRPASI